MKPSPPYPLEWLNPSTGFRPLWTGGGVEFQQFARQLYDYLDQMPRGRSVTFRRYTGRRLQWCIATAAAYLHEGTHWLEFQLMDDYLTIRRLPRPAKLPHHRHRRAASSPPSNP